jgi:two-component system, LytTR family, response regulator
MSDFSDFIQLYSKKSVASDDIVYLEADCNYTYIHTRTGRPLCLPRTIGSFELNPQCFVRINRKYIINLSHLISFTRTNVKLCDGSVLPISRRNSKSICQLQTH